jgi:ABC-2 type transport system permease protein
VIYIFKKEFTAYFTTPFGFVFLGIFLLVSGIMFTIYNLLGANGNLAGTFDLMKNISFIMFPVLTMRMFAEERRSGTELLLLTSRLRVSDIVLGKFLSSVALFVTALCATLIYVCVIISYGMPNYGYLAGSYLGFFLLGTSMIAVCTFASSFAENQITAAIASFGMLFFMIILASFTHSLRIPVLTPLLSAIAITTRYDEFTRGVLRAGPVAYYLFMTGTMLFFTIKNLEKRRFN